MRCTSCLLTLTPPRPPHPPGSLRITGTNVNENDYVKMGQFHTVTLERDSPFAGTQSRKNTDTVWRMRHAPQTTYSLPPFPPLPPCTNATHFLLSLPCPHALTPLVYKLSWDTMYLSRLDDAVDPAAKADIACIVMQEGLAHVCLVTPFLTQTRARIER